MNRHNDQNASKRNKMQSLKQLKSHKYLYAFLTLLFLFPGVVNASETVYERVDPSKAMHEELVEDMRVKVLGGSISVQRFYRSMKRDPDPGLAFLTNLGVSGSTGAYIGNSLLTSFANGDHLSQGQREALRMLGKSRKDAGVWQFHRKWHDLIFLGPNGLQPGVANGSSSGGGGGSSSTTSPDGGSTSALSDPQKLIHYIDRNDYLYERERGTDYFVYQYNGADLRITITDYGYRWTNRNGDWIDYDNKGRAFASGDKNNVTIQLVRNSKGKIEQYKDHLGNVILTWAYEGPNPVSVTDYAGRIVTYTWNGPNLVEVTDVLGNKWTYDYAGVLTSKTDPEEQTFRYDYQKSKGGFQSTTSSSLANNIGAGQAGRTTSTSSSNRSTRGYPATVTVPSILMHVGKIYPDGKRVAYQYQYDFEANAYMVLEKNSDGYELERWFDLDGQTRYALEGGKLSATRIRAGSTTVSTDPYGNRTIVSYDRWEAIKSIKYPDGSTKSYGYLPNFNFPTLEIDEVGVKTKHEYDLSGNRIRTIADYEGDEPRTMEYDYDAFGQVKVERYIGQGDTPTIEIKYDYDSYGNVTKVTDARGNITQYQDYNASGQYQTITDGRGKTWRFTYDQFGRTLTSTTPLGFVTRYEYDKLHRLVKTTDAENRVTQYTYDSRNNRTSSTDNDGGVKELTYRIDGLVKTHKDESGQVTTYRYDRTARPVEITDGVGNQIEIEYDRGDELAGSRIETIITPNNRIFLDYDARNRVILQNLISVKDDGLVSSTAIQYNGRGEQLVTTDPNGNTIRRSYTAHSEVASETNGEGEEVTYGYDVRGNLLSVTDALEKTTTYGYDNNNNRNSEMRPMGEQQTYSYDANNNLIGHIDYNGNTAAYGFDDDNRRTTQTNTKAGASLAERSIIYSYDKTNLQKGYSDNASSASYQYDVLGRLEEQTVTFNTGGANFSKTIKAAYHKNSQIKSRTDAENNATTYSYDGAGKLTQIAIQGAGSILLNGYEGNLVNSITYPGGITRNQEYDGLARLKRINVKDNGGNPKMDYQYTFDLVGNITNKTTDLGEFVYGYDNAYRVTSADQPNSFGNQTFSYDNNSNRLTLNKTASQSGYSYNNNHELIEIAETVGNDTTIQKFQYDNNGAQTIELDANDNQVQTKHYNSYGRLERVEQSGVTLGEYQYNPYGQRISKTVNGQTTYFVYDQTGVGLLGEYDATGALITGYVYNPDGYFTTDPVAQKSPLLDTNGVLTGYEHYFYQNDYIGTPQQLIKSSGVTVWEGEYDLFGGVNETNSGAQSMLRFPGQYQDVETGQYYNWNRYYNAGVGRYVSSDPIGLHGGLSLYSYAYQNTLIYFDDDGRVAWMFAGAGLELLRQLYDNGGNLSCVNWLGVGLAGAGGAIGGAYLGGLKKGLGGLHKLKRNSATKKFKDKNGRLGQGYETHHGIVRAKGKSGPSWRHHFMNFKDLKEKTHRRIHGSFKGEPKFNPVVGKFIGLPDWLKQAGGSAIAGGAAGTSGCEELCK